jgi:NTP pyrophosphatase (non-canonical NTP hydrolase)
MENVLEEIREERKRQDAKWGADRELDDFVWLAILTEEVGETSEAILKDMLSKRKELVQVAAVAVAWLECLDRRHLTRAVPDVANACPNCGCFENVLTCSQCGSTRATQVS